MVESECKHRLSPNRKFSKRHVDRLRRRQEQPTLINLEVLSNTHGRSHYMNALMRSGPANNLPTLGACSGFSINNARGVGCCSVSGCCRPSKNRTRYYPRFLLWNTFPYITCFIALIINCFDILCLVRWNFDEFYCRNFKAKIRRTKYNLVIKLITRMGVKPRDEYIKYN